MKKVTKKAVETKKTAGGEKAATRRPKKAAAAQFETISAGANGASTPKRGDKGAAILALIQRNGGATAAELMEATGWQPHSVRGFLSTASKKQGLNIASARRDDGQRVYNVEA
jgi:Protein of unknown function (DUF3489)